MGAGRDGVLEISVLPESVDAARMNDRATEDAKSNYSLNVSLSERDRSSEALVLAFTIELTSQPQAARFRVMGRASLKGSKDEIRTEITAPDDSRPPPILVTIYERVYSTIYVLAGALKVPSPMPNLLKKSP